MQTWNEDQLTTFLETTSEDRLFPLWRLSAMSGMRRGEVLGLRWEDFDAIASVLTVQRQWKRGERGHVLAQPKTNQGRRTIDIDRDTTTALEAWRERQLEEREAADVEWLGTDRGHRTHEEAADRSANSTEPRTRGRRSPQAGLVG